MVLSDQPLDVQVAELGKMLRLNDRLMHILKALEKTGAPDAYLGGGSIVQTVWNCIYGYEIDYGIDDFDIVYFDPADLSEAAEDKWIKSIMSEIGSVPYKIDIKNEARVHLWYPKHFGIEIEPYTSSENAISTWISTSTAVAVRLRNGKLQVFAPYGLADAFNGIIKPTEAVKHREIEAFRKKAAKWHGKWPQTEIVE